AAPLLPTRQPGASGRARQVPDPRPSTALEHHRVDEAAAPAGHRTAPRRGTGRTAPYLSVTPYASIRSVGRTRRPSTSSLIATSWRSLWRKIHGASSYTTSSASA